MERKWLIYDRISCEKSYFKDLMNKLSLINIKLLETGGNVIVFKLKV
jgi:hypothetical protein